jgi:aminoglycoside phosphotransferase (APT) family kinase protein
MTVESWKAFVDVDRLTEWMNDKHLESGPLTEVEPLVGGTQNVVIRFKRGGRVFVLRRPPPNPHLDGNKIMRREARVLKALAGTDVPHPRLIADCPNEDVLGAAFYLMEFVVGFDPRQLPESHAADPRLRERMGYALADGIASLSHVDHVAAGLEDIGKVDGFLDRQVERWHKQLESYTQYAGWPGPAALSGVDRLAAWLERNQPREFHPGILHGDYHFPNVLYRYESAELAAIIDWELATVGDPLIDLGWMLATWPDVDGNSPIMSIRPWSGFPTADQLIRRYAENSGRDVGAADWYTVFGCYKLAVLLEGSHARSLAGKAPLEIGERLHSRARVLVDRGLARIA